ncbi:hypothetical protein TSUD_114850 [Trifolium subterraneum]|uniref:Fucosyltransferase n=1 Tax=Trifolium subterraneum TaxID=3900 RepID=A0A2Z6MH31_TRISU|nr:hypothetical protein TSUD_114850 [Trifolium subterraneum]
MMVMELRFRTLLLVVSFITTFSIFTFLILHHNNNNSISLLRGFSNINLLLPPPPSTSTSAPAPPNNNNKQQQQQQLHNITTLEYDDDDEEEGEKGNHSIIVTEDLFQQPPPPHTQTIPDDPKLLDGLLVSTFHKPSSCLSRYQSHLYRKPSPYKPSAYLISKLRNYERLHTTCGPHTKSYAKIIITTTKNPTHCKYLVWTPSNGLGNRIITLAATFLYAILTDRHSHDGHNNFFHCDQSQALLQKVPVLILSSDQYFVPSLFMIPSFQQELSKMFPEKDTVFHHLGRYLFQPSNEAWELIRSFYEAHLANANEKIGLQIRSWRFKAMDSKEGIWGNHPKSTLSTSNVHGALFPLRRTGRNGFIGMVPYSQFSELMGNLAGLKSSACASAK